MKRSNGTVGCIRQQGIDGIHGRPSPFFEVRCRHRCRCEWIGGDGRVQIGNNLIENAIRPTKLGARNWLFIGNEASGEKSAILHTIVENCRRLGINSKEYLEDVLTRLPAMQAKDAVTLTPGNWLKARSGNAAKKAA